MRIANQLMDDKVPITRVKINTECDVNYYSWGRDVYKRQSYADTEYKITELGITRTLALKRNQVLLDAVSYTHLDVYKRQLRYSLHLVAWQATLF